MVVGVILFLLFFFIRHRHPDVSGLTDAPSGGPRVADCGERQILPRDERLERPGRRLRLLRPGGRSRGQSRAASHDLRQGRDDRRGRECPSGHRLREDVEGAEFRRGQMA